MELCEACGQPMCEECGGCGCPGNDCMCDFADPDKGTGEKVVSVDEDEEM